MIFYLGTHQPAWLATVGVPLFVSRVRLAGRRKLPCRPSGSIWALDSGGFSEIATHGRWTIDDRQLVDEVRRYHGEIEGLRWSACRDWMCEAPMLRKTGLRIAEHQRRTTDSYIELMQLAPDLPWAPVLQGYDPDDYLRHVEHYQSRGVDLGAAPIVGLGTMCRRQATGEALAVLRALAESGLRLHGFGLKQLAFLEGAAQYLASADSLAWSMRGRRIRPCANRRTDRRGRPVMSCANCQHHALAYYDKALETISKRARQPRHSAYSVAPRWQLRLPGAACA